MRNKDLIMSLSKQFLNKSQLAKLDHVLESVLTPSHLDLGDDDLIERFLSRLEAKNYSAKTILQYRSLLNSLSANNERYFLDMDAEDVESYLAARSNEGLSPTTINGMIGCYRSFFKWLTTFEYIPKNPMDKVDTIRTEKKVKEAFTNKQIEIMRSHITNVRNRAIMELLLGSGMRVSELCKLKFSDLNLSASPYTATINGKGNKQRKIPISNTSVYYLAKYIETRKDTSDNEYVFKKLHHNEHITPACITELCLNWSEELGFHIHAHKFRRTFCSELVNRGMSLAYAQKIMGHATPSTTMIYTNVKDNLIYADFAKIANL